MLRTYRMNHPRWRSRRDRRKRSLNNQMDIRKAIRRRKPNLDERTRIRYLREDQIRFWRRCVQNTQMQSLWQETMP